MKNSTLTQLQPRTERRKIGRRYFEDRGKSVHVKRRLIVLPGNVYRLMSNSNTLQAYDDDYEKST